MPIETILILLPTSIVFICIMILVATKYKGFAEEDHLSEIKLVSPAFKLIKNVVKKSFSSSEVLLILLTVYILSLTVAYTSSFAFTSQIIPTETRYSALFVGKHLVPLEVIDSIIQNYILVYQIFKGIEINESTYYVLIIKCSFNYINENSVDIRSDFYRYCDYISQNYVIADDDSYVDMEILSNFLGMDIQLVKVDFFKLMNLELLPGIYFVHSIGTIGGLSLRIEDENKILLIPASINIEKKLCSEGCEVQTVVIGFDPIERYKNEVNKVLDVFDYIALNIDGGLQVLSRSLTPTSKTLMSMFLSFVISMIMIYAVGGGFIEKMLSMSRDLFILGATRKFFKSAVLLGTTITLFLMSLPLVIIVWMGLINSVAALNYVISVVGFIVMTSHRLRSITGEVLHPGFIGSYSYVVSIYTSLDKLTSCLRDILSDDDFFAISEVEGIKEEKVQIIRIELIYKKALSTLASVEIYVDRINNNFRYTVFVDVWSMEDSTREFLSSIQRLALSKTVGGVISCIES